MTSTPPPETVVGRREYDKLQADYVTLSHLVVSLTEKITNLTNEVAASRSDTKELSDFLRTAKGVNSFVLWLSKFLIGAGIITAFFKWGPLK